MPNITNITLVTNEASNTSYQHISGIIYNNSLFELGAAPTSSMVFNEDDYIPLLDINGFVLNCPIYDEPNVDYSRYIEAKIGDTYISHWTASAYFLHTNGSDGGSPDNICYGGVSPLQEQEFSESLFDDVSASMIAPQNLQGLFGRITRTVNNSTLINTHYTAPTNCSTSCPAGQCFGSIEDVLPFSINNTTFSTFSAESCRRVVAVYLGGDELRNSSRQTLTYDQVRDIENPCGIDAICSVGNIGNYTSNLRLKLNPASIVGEPVDSIANVSIGVNGYLPCNISESNSTLITERTERIVYTDGSCSDFEHNTCLHEGDYESLGDIILQGSKTINHETIVDNYIEQNCPEPVCGSEFCPTTATTVTTEAAVTNATTITNGTTATTAATITNATAAATITNATAETNVTNGTTATTVTTSTTSTTVITDIENNSLTDETITQTDEISNIAVMAGGIAGGIAFLVLTAGIIAATLIAIAKYKNSFKSLFNKIFKRGDYKITSDYQLESQTKNKADTSAV